MIMMIMGASSTANAVEVVDMSTDETATISAHDKPLVPDNDNISDSDKMEEDFILDPLLKYLDPTAPRHHRRHEQHPSPRFNVDDAINALKCEGYYHIPSVITHEECTEALGNLWDFVEDVSGGCVLRQDPLSWYPPHEVCIVNNQDDATTMEDDRGRISVKDDENLLDTSRNNCGGDNAAHPIISTDPNEHDDLDPWPHTGYHSFPDMFQSLGAGYVLGNVRQHLAERVFEPLFGTRELVCSKEGFTFCRPLIVDLEEGAHHHQEQKYKQTQKDVNCKNVLVWKPHHLNSLVLDSTNNVGKDQSGDVHRKRPLFQVCGKPQPMSEGQHYDQGVPVSVVRRIRDGHSHPEASSNKVSKKQQNRNRKKLDKLQKLKDLTGLCHIQASISFTDQTLDRHRGGGHFLCYPYSHSDVHWKLVGGTYRATPSEKERADPTWVPLTDEEIQKLAEMGCPEKRIYANAGDVILWRSDLVHAGVAPSMHVDEQSENTKLKCSGSKQFRAVGYCSMLPTHAVKEYMMYSLEKQKVAPYRGKTSLSRVPANNSLLHDPQAAQQMIDAMSEKLFHQKLESYKTGRTGDHRPDVEQWHQHRRITMWNNTESHHCNDSELRQCKLIPPRILQRPRYRLEKPELTLRLAKLYGLLPYRTPEDDAEMRHKDIERAVIRGVRFVEGVYNGRHLNGEDVGSWKMSDGKFCSVVGSHADASTSNDTIPICLATMEMLKPRSEDCTSGLLTGQDKYLGGMASPCGRYIYGVPGHAKRVVRVDVRSGEVALIGPEYSGDFKWLRGVEIPAEVMGRDAYPSGCCLALPCNSENGCVLKIDPETANVITFVSGQSVPNVDEGWLYHGGNLAADKFVYAIPASANRVMKIDAREETTEYIGPEYDGKAKWYGGIMGVDGCIYGIPHNATGVLKINPSTQEVTILAEGTLPNGQWKWHGGLASKDRSKIIGFPNNADSILVIDVVIQRVRMVGNSSILRSGYHRVPQDGGYKYLGGSITSDGKFAYLFPCDAEYVLRFDMETDELKLVGPQLTEGENKFQNGFLGRDGCIYGVPQRSSGILRIIPPGVHRYGRDGVALSNEEEYIDVMYVGDEMVSCKDKFEGGVLSMDGQIYCIPLRAKSFINVIPGKRA